MQSPKAIAENVGLAQYCPCWRVTTFDGTHEDYCPIFRVAAACQSYGDERAHEMQERCAQAMALYQDIVDEARRKAGYANSLDLAAIVRALPD